MRKLLFTSVMLLMAMAINAQSNRTVETQKDRYGHVTGTATITTDSRGNQTTVYKDQYGHIIGRSETRAKSNGQTTTTYKDQYGHVTGSSTTRQSYNGSNTKTSL